MMGSLIKTFFAKKIGVPPQQIRVTSIMPCTAKKGEADRPQLRTQLESGELVKDTDFVLTTRELGHLFKLQNIPLNSQEPKEFDDPLGASTGAAVLFGASGGVMEAAIRTAYEIFTGQKLEQMNLSQVRGLQGVKEVTLKMTPAGGGSEVELRCAVVNGTANTRHFLETLKTGQLKYHFIEVMACPGGLWPG